jgi:hypothetical protein
LWTQTRGSSIAPGGPGTSTRSPSEAFPARELSVNTL